MWERCAVSPFYMDIELVHASLRHFPTLEVFYPPPVNSDREAGSDGHDDNELIAVLS